MKIVKGILMVISCCVWLSSMAQQTSNYSISTPQKGEGLNAFLIRNKLNPQEHLQTFIKLNKTKLGNNNSLIMGEEYSLPSTKVFLHEPLFGRDRTNFELESQELRGAVFYLVSGHGGPDPGALGKYGGNTLAEDEYAYDITLRLAKKLMENGAKVNLIIQDANDGIRDKSYLPMDKDETCLGAQIPLEQNERLKQRTKEVNKLYIKNKPSFQRCIVIHVDSRSKGKSIDVFFYHAPKSKSGKKAAESILKVFDSKYNQYQPSRGYSGIVNSRNLYLLRKTYPTSVFVELGNIRNLRDQQRFILENNRQAIANWMYEGLLNDFKNNK